MEITLNIKGEEKTFTQSFVKFKIKREALEVEKYAQDPGRSD
ncbi:MULTISPECIES: phage tail assembly chaperone G [Bacillus amyloliquefaciens group]